MMRTVLAGLLATGLLMVSPPAPPTAHAADLCADFGGAVEPDGLCRTKVTTPNYELSMSFPVDFPDQAAVDDFLTQTRTGFLNGTGTTNFAGVPYAMDLTASVWASDTTRSVSFEVYQNMGGAHPDTWYKAFNYDTVRNRPIAFADLFGPGVDPLTAIYPIVTQKLSTDMGVPAPIIDSDGMDPSHYQNFAITPVDVVFFFGRGELMAGAAGAHTVYVPRNAIPPLAV
ncbi:esterase [Mycolicibacterium stellerae]|uniref:esterase n=1 Tax=Mycolicibacterium stellerae TaxID=2358193 RepID=UPI000F0B3BB8|nr:esterase [Mycolicibacterium stellerae]